MKPILLFIIAVVTFFGCTISQDQKGKVLEVAGGQITGIQLEFTFLRASRLQHPLWVT